MLGKSGVAALLSYALSSSSSMLIDRGYAKMTGQGFSSKSRNEKAKSKRAKDKQAKASRKKNR